MILLTGTSDLVQLVTAATATIDVHADWVDSSASAVTPGRTNTAITTAATTTVVGSPASGVQRNLKTLNVRNKDASNSCDVTVRHTDGTTAVELHRVTLPPGTALQYIDGTGFVLAPSAVTASGLVLILAQTVAAAASVDFTGLLTSAYDEYELHFYDVYSSSNADSLVGRIGEGGVYQSATFYRYAAFVTGDAGTNASSGNTAGALFVASYPAFVSNVAANAVSGRIRIPHPSIAGKYKTCRWESEHWSSSGQVLASHGSFVWTSDTNAIDSIRLYMGTGTITGTFKLFGIR